MNGLQTIIAWLVLAMSSWCPTTKAWYPHAMVSAHPDVIETPEAMQVRYQSIATDMATVVFDPSYVPVSSETGRGRDALIALAIASYESGYRSDIDLGYTLGDSNASYCMMQVWLPGSSKTVRGWVGKDLTDRTKCFIAATDRMRASWNACHSLEILDRLSGYTIGQCKVGEPKSRFRTGRAVKWMKEHPVPVTDIMVMNKE